MRTKLTYEERKEIGQMMREHHGVFYKFWELVCPYYDEVGTACVGIDAKNRNLSFSIDKAFWDKQSDEQKRFIISHEAYHLINQHGKRANGKFGDAKNQTLDIPINEGLVKYFGFDRGVIDPHNELCWVNTVFTPEENAETGRSFEYYYDLLKKNGGCGVEGLMFNDHSNMTPEMEREILERLIDSLDENEAESLKKILERAQVKDNKEGNGQGANGQGCGTGTAGTMFLLEKKTIKPKPKWETIIKKYARRKVDNSFDVNHWILKDRRMALFDPEFMLPHDINVDDRQSKKEKQRIFVFLDVSGSCSGHRQRFYDAFKSIPKTIEVRLFSFDDRAYELDKKDTKVFGGGGTSIRCIEDKIQEIVTNEKIIYPKNVFVLTDGYFPKYKPQYPDRWVFLLTTDAEGALPERSARHQLSNFE